VITRGRALLAVAAVKVAVPVAVVDIDSMREKLEAIAASR